MGDKVYDRCSELIIDTMIGRRYVALVSNDVVKSIRSTIRQWHLTWRTDKSLEDLSHMFNPVIRGWINYYGSFYKSALNSTLQHLDYILAWWASRKCKRLRGPENIDALMATYCTPWSE